MAAFENQNYEPSVPPDLANLWYGHVLLSSGTTTFLGLEDTICGQLAGDVTEDVKFCSVEVDKTDVLRIDLELEGSQELALALMAGLALQTLIKQKVNLEHVRYEGGNLFSGVLMAIKHALGSTDRPTGYPPDPPLQETFQLLREWRLADKAGNAMPQTVT